ncbi:MAG: hypothetical protein CMC22_02080 [Flavobacteriaceae bacterium]|nr:hypothetical protein [Flavobacteriaceae bacterium]
MNIYELFIIQYNQNPQNQILIKICLVDSQSVFKCNTIQGVFFQPFRGFCYFSLMKNLILNTSAFRYIFEIIIIVFSVTLSFYIQSIIIDREKIELKNKSLKGVSKDLVEDIEYFNSAQKTLANRIKNIEIFLSGEISNGIINDIMLTYDFSGVNSNYKSLLSTGAVEHIIDEQLVKELTNYYERNYSVLEDLFGQYKHLYLDFLEFMASNYPVESMNKITLLENKLVQGNPSFRYSKKTLLNLNQDFEFQNHVYSLKRIIIVYVRFYQSAIERNKKLAILIENELNN